MFVHYLFFDSFVAHLLFLFLLSLLLFLFTCFCSPSLFCLSSLCPFCYLSPSLLFSCFFPLPPSFPFCSHIFTLNVLLSIDRFHLTNFCTIHSRKLLPFSRVSQVKSSPKSLGRYEVSIRSYIHLNFVIRRERCLVLV